MKYCVIIILFGVAAHTDASVTQPANVSDAADGDSNRNFKSAHDRTEEETSVGSKRDGVESERDSAKNIRRSDDGADDNKVIAVGLDTGAAETKNNIVQAISDAFGGGGLVKSKYSRSNAGPADKKKPLGLELRSDVILQSLQNFLSSAKVKKVTRDLAKKAAIIYRAIEKEF